MSDRDCFDDIRQQAKRIAFVELSPLMESLAVNNLQPKERDGRIYREIAKVEEVMKRYSQYHYIMYYDDPELLFELFVGNDPLHHPQELDIFRKSMIHREKYNILYHLYMENRARHQAENYSATSQVLLPSPLNEQPMETWNLPWQNIYLPYASGLFTNGMNLSGSRTIPSIEAILTMIILKMNERINYLKYETDILKLVGIILNPTSVEKGVEILLGCKTTEFKYSIPHLQSYNKGFTYANIGRACCIISKNGNLITSRNLGSTSCKNINTRHAIDNIFAEFRKKYGFH